MVTNLIRLFLLPILLVINNFIYHGDSSSIKDYIIVFCVAFFLNWIADKTIVSWAIKKGKENKK